MPAKLTLNKLAENLILESNTSFSSGDFEKTIREKWQQEIPNATLKKLKKKLFAHNYLIETNTDDFLPIPVALQKIKNLSLSIRLNSFEINKIKNYFLFLKKNFPLAIIYANFLNEVIAISQHQESIRRGDLLHK